LKLARALCATLGVALLVACALARAGDYDWRFDLIAHFKPQLATGLGIVALLAWAAGARRFAMLFLLGCAVELVAIEPYIVTTGALRAESRSPTVRAITFNVLRWNNAHAQVIDYLERAQADVIALQEIDAVWLGALTPLAARYPHRIVPAGRASTVVLFSRWPLDARHVHYERASGRPIIAARVMAPGRPFEILATHTRAPISSIGHNAEGNRIRNAHLAELAVLARAATEPVLLLGDLNISPWSVHFRRLLDVSGLENARRGFGLIPTWSSRHPWWLRVPIDHALYRGGVRFIDVASGPMLGSDHLPLEILFTID
jgi:endonuclease/exonuclease/phosphatase (EEP) superfamily protein YafD